MPWNLRNVMCNIIFKKYCSILVAHFTPFLPLVLFIIDTPSADRSLKASPAIDEMATAFLKRSEAYKGEFEEGKGFLKKRGEEAVSLRG